MRLHELLEEAGVELRVVALVQGELVRGPDVEKPLDELDDAFLLRNVEERVELWPQALSRKSPRQLA